MISNLLERFIPSASTSDHQPIPSTATRKGSTLINLNFLSSRCDSSLVPGSRRATKRDQCNLGHSSVTSNRLGSALLDHHHTVPGMAHAAPQPVVTTANPSAETNRRPPPD